MFHYICKDNIYLACLQYVAFCRTKDGKPRRETRPFASQKATFYKTDKDKAKRRRANAAQGRPANDNL